MRRALALIAVLALLALAGCTGTVSKADLAENATYDWSTTEPVQLTVAGDTYRAVYTFENRSTVELYTRDPLGQEHPLPISALYFRAPNGTVYNHTVIEVTETGRRVRLQLPNRTGQLAVSAPVSGERLTARTVRTGAYRVRLPPNATVGLPVLSRVHPGNYTVERSGNRTAVVWSNVTSDRVAVQYYHERDPLLLVAFVAAVLLVIGAGGAYYLLTLRRLERRRAEAGLDIERE
ncbi:MAG: DUF5803 family protein [Halococcoides sp.]